jgi:hypothetical protein
MYSKNKTTSCFKPLDREKVRMFTTKCEMAENEIMNYKNIVFASIVYL